MHADLLTRAIGSLPRRPGFLGCAVLVQLLAARPMAAQSLPGGPLTLAGGAVTIGGEVSATVGPDDTGFYNFTDYDISMLRLLRTDISGAARVGEHVTILGQMRTQNLESLDLFALYLRWRPSVRRAFDIQVGHIPPTFGAFGRNVYGPDHVLVGYPLAYQYLTSLRPDAIPANGDELLRMRGRGWLSSFSIGNPDPAAGVPLVSAFRWDTGVQVHARSDRVEVTAAATAGTVSSPVFRPLHGLPQMVGRAAVRPVTGLVVGASASRGPFLTGSALGALPPELETGRFTQRGWGTDVEYSRDYYLLRFELIGSRWTIPFVSAQTIDRPLTARGISFEARYRLRPGVTVAARADRLDFSTIAGTGRQAEWDAPVRRVEVGGAYSLQRNVQARLSFQHNSRDTARVGRFRALAAQLSYWF